MTSSHSQASVVSSTPIPSSSSAIVDTRATSAIVDTRVSCIRPLLPPICLLEELPMSAELDSFVARSRSAICDIIHQRDDRLFVVIGPCSIHDTAAALEYARKLKIEADKYATTICIAMRVYFEKPRTTVGWKGLLNDPHMDDTNQINLGLRIGRLLMLDILRLGLPIANEALDVVSPQFLGDLMCWSAIGARTTESQLHRELASGLSCPVGFKNGTAGSIKVAVDAIIAARSPHCFLGVTSQGLAAIVQTKGNPDTHVVLRGGDDGPNYSESHVAQATGLLQQAQLVPSVMIDCSHGNSQKNYENQPLVVKSICEQLTKVNRSIIGVMIESNLNAGNQKLIVGPKAKDSLKYGVSVTDACIDWATSQQVLQDLHVAVLARRQKV